jgi:hypothetical protein
MSKLIRRFEFEDKEYLLVGSIHGKKESRIIIEKVYIIHYCDLYAIQCTREATGTISMRHFIPVSNES